MNRGSRGIVIFTITILMSIIILGCNTPVAEPTQSPTQVMETINAVLTQYVMETAAAYVPPTATETPMPTETPTATLAPAGDEQPASTDLTPIGDATAASTPPADAQGTPAAPGPNAAASSGGVNFTDAKVFVARTGTQYQVTIVLPNDTEERKTAGFSATVAGKPFECMDLYQMKKVNRIICVGTGLYDFKNTLQRVLIYSPKGSTTKIFEADVSIPG